MFSSQTVINDVPPYTQALAILGQTVYGTNWTANAASDVVVYVTPSGSPPNDATQILTSAQYTVDFIGDQQQVQVTLVTPSSAGDIVTVTRMTPADRENLYNNTNFVPSMLNNDFGILTLVDQQAQLVNQQIAPRYNYSAQINVNMPGSTRDTILPLLGASQIWAMNPTQTAIVAVNLNEIISGGTVTQVNTGLGLTGGPITTAGTISFASMPANTFWGNITAGVALPTQVSTGYFLITSNNLSDIPNATTARANLGLAIGVNVEAWSAALDSIAGLTTVANNLIYTTAANTYHVLAPVIDSVLISSHTGVPTWTLTLPQGVQTNIQYLGIQNQNLDMGGHNVGDMADPIQPQDAATKNYVDLNALTGTSVYAATTTNLTVTQSGSGVGATLTNAGAQATFALDSVNPPLNSNVLVKDLAAPQHEGIYTVTDVGSGATNWVLTRATSYDTPTEINHTGLIIVQNGTTLAGTAWYNAVTIVTVDSTNFSYSEFGNIVFPVSLAHGGTNANLTASLGAVVYSTATALALTAVGSTGQILRSAGAATPVWSTATFPATGGAAGNILISDGTNYISSTSLWPNTVGSAGKIVRSDGTTNAYTTATYPNVATSTGTMLRADGTNWVPTTATFADTYTASNLLYSNGANTVVGLATANSSVLVTDGSGVPSLSTTLPSGLTIPGFAKSGANTDITSMTGLTGTLQAPTGITSSTGANLLIFTYTASAVNYISIINNITGAPPSISAVGSDTNVILQLGGKGTGGAAVQGTGTNDNATAGFVGEYKETIVLGSSPVTATNNTIIDMASIANLPAGDWDVWGCMNLVSVGTNPTIAICWISSSSATLLDQSDGYVGIQASATTVTLADGTGFAIPIKRFSLASATTIYLSAFCSNSVGNSTICGKIMARRPR